MPLRMALLALLAKSQSGVPHAEILSSLVLRSRPWPGNSGYRTKTSPTSLFKDPRCKVLLLLIHDIGRFRYVLAQLA